MTEKRQYRSALRSKQWIREAFLQLLREKPYEKITVTDIVGRAGINRSTFYAHYCDVFAVIEEIRDELLDAATGPLRDLNKSIFEDPKPYLRMMENLIMENRELYILLAKTDMLRHQLDQIKVYLVNNSMKSLDIPQDVAESKQIQMRCTFFVGGVVDLYLRWIEEQMDCSLDDISKEVANLIENSVQEIYAPRKE